MSISPKKVGICSLTAAALILPTTSCGNGTSTSGGGSSTSPAESSPAETSPAETSPAETSGSLADDCVRPLVTGPGASGQTTISAILNGDWPSAPEIHASVQFMDSTQIYDFNDQGQSVEVSDSSGAAVSTAKVWITDSGDFRVECNIWVRQP